MLESEAYLRRQGWKGTGHSLDKHGHGIKKPLLIAHKQDQLGLGKKKAAHNVDDQWWMRAFDESLKNIGSGQESTLSQVRDKGINRGGLYGFFVKGEGLAGTISTTEESSAAEASNTSTPASPASTPPTTASDSASESDSDGTEGSSEDSDVSCEASAMAKKNNKRKRGKEEQDKVNKKLMMERLEDSAANPPPRTVTTILGTMDVAEMQRINSIMRLIGRKVETTLNSDAKKGVYGTWIDPNKLKGKKKGMTALHFVDPANPGKIVTHEAAKYEREKKMRQARKELLRDKIVTAMLKGKLPNPEGWTREEAFTKFPRIKNALLTIKKGERKVRRSEKDVRKLEQIREKKERQEVEREQRELGKAAAKAEEQAKMKAIVEKKLAKLSDEEKAEYQERAQEKGQSLDEYILRRVEKKKKKATEKKMRAISHLTRDILLDMGVTEGATREQMNLARSRAKKLMKQEKRERTKQGGIHKLVDNKKKRHRVSERAKARDAEAKARELGMVGEKEHEVGARVKAVAAAGGQGDLEEEVKSFLDLEGPGLVRLS